jgi:hypothetical protein
VHDIAGKDAVVAYQVERVVVFGAIDGHASVISANAGVRVDQRDRGMVIEKAGQAI